ncbi:LysR family transcriptional regulator [Acetonema longum]|uniref:LysR family transcriptional regulator n=1 Tax=Acetonema longum DSM 6540 TaxID=1009370 RepID=F7NDF8_9FIRM|nr:LysR family transcriptional regulator [Acetonema longum]EGO65911.1 LysR family transcriptional regulator [Acetonema longum DSM 6540]
MELRQLEYFQMVAKTNSITRAAEQLHVSQSTVTLAIQRLEDELNSPLLDRSQKQLSLTSEGKVFIQKVSDAFNLLQDGIAEVNNYRQLKKGTLKVGVPPMIGSYLFPEILAGFKKHYPNLDLAIFEESSFYIRQLLEKGELDIGIVNLFQPSQLLETLSIANEQIVVCLPLTHQLAKLSTIAIEKLKEEPFILFKAGAYNRQIILEECRKHGFDPHIILATDQIETMKGSVIKGVGICFLMEEIARRGTEYVSISLANPLYLEFGLAWKKDRYLSMAVQAFINFIRESSFAHQNPS